MTKLKHAAVAAGLTIAFAGALMGPVKAYATVEGDQTPATQAEIDAALASGEIQTELPEMPVVFANKDYAVKTIGGSNRYETSAAQARFAFSSSEWAVVASGAGYADSICAAGLAGALKCPIILTESSSVPACTASALKDLGVKHVILLGSEAVASAQVEAQLRDIVAGGSVERVFGADRYQTQMAVYEYGRGHGLWDGSTAVVSNATGFADALSISPVSYKLHAPVFYVDGSKTLPQSQSDAIKASGFNRYLVTGDGAVMSPSVTAMLKEKGQVVSLAGNNRYETSKAISNYAVSSLGMSWNAVAFTSGQAPYDALGGGPVQGSANAVLCLMDESSDYKTASLPFEGKPSSMRFFGDKVIYSSAFKTRCALKAGFALSDVQGLVVYVDAGHGGGDSGALGNGYRECDLTRELAYKVADKLRSDYGVACYVNDKGNNYKLRHPEAKQMDCGALVSIHFNSAGGAGVESYVHSLRSAAGSDVLQRSVHRNLVSAMGTRDRGMKREQFAVVSGPLPSVLLEVAFIDNSTDINTYQARKDTVAAAIARGIAEA